MENRVIDLNARMLYNGSRESSVPGFPILAGHRKQMGGWKQQSEWLNEEFRKKNVQEVAIMLAAVKGILQGNTVIIEDDDIRKYDGAEVIVTLLNPPQRQERKEPVDWDSFTVPSERGAKVEEYMREMRENDRL